MDRPLPFTPRPQPGESPLAVLQRAAMGNHRRRTSQVVYAFDTEFDHSVTGLGSLVRNPRRFAAFCEAIGIDPAETPNAQLHRIGHARVDDMLWQGLKIGAGDIDTRRAKICPACLVEHGYARADWDHVGAVGCHLHHTLLESECAGCKSPHTYLDDPLGCNCNTKARILHAKRCSADAASLLRRIVEAHDQGGLDRLTALHQVLNDWTNLGVTLTPAARAESLCRLHQGRWPEASDLPPPAGDALHPRVALAGLLDHSNAAIRAHADRLLAISAPTVVATDCASARWTKCRAQAVLSIGRLVLQRALDSGLLTADPDGRIHVSSINALLWRITTGPSAPANAGRSLQALRAGSDRLAATDVIGAICEGHAATGGDIVCAGLSGLRTDIPARPAIKPGEEVGVAEAARRLGTNTESIRALARIGLLDGCMQVQDGVRRLAFHPRQLEAFSREYAFASEFSKRLGAAPTTLASRLRHAGVQPVSGPGIDAGVTYLFRRSQIEAIDLADLLAEPYSSPAGRRRKACRTEAQLMSREVAEQLGLPTTAIRELVRDGWLEPLKYPAAKRTFERRHVEAVKHAVAHRFVDVDEAAALLGQSRQAFLRTWSIAGVIQTRRFRDRLLVSSAEVARIEVMWRDMGTAAAIGASLGRDRTLCPNLEKMGLIRPARVLGEGARKVRLYRRDEPAYEKYRMPGCERLHLTNADQPGDNISDSPSTH